MRMSRIKLRKTICTAAILSPVLLFILVKYVRFQNSLATFSDNVQSWVEDAMGVSYGVKYCSSLPKWTKDSKYPPVQAVASELGLKDGETIFINGLRCGEWLVALQGTFPKVKLYGVDTDAEAVEYVKTVANGTFAVAAPWELAGLEFKDQFGKPITGFDRALIDGILSSHEQEVQCDTIRSMVPLVKAGGSLYIGKNFEPCRGSADLQSMERYLRKSIRLHILPECFWPNNCLKDRHDISEILYMNESHLLYKDGVTDQAIIPGGMEPAVTKCATSVFIFKNILMLETHNKDPLQPDAKYVKHKHAHICTLSELKNATKQDINWVKSNREGILNAVKQIKVKGIDMR